FFFFQAEDGIRDGHVTGVQTCALPISARPAFGTAGEADADRKAGAFLEFLVSLDTAKRVLGIESEALKELQARLDAGFERAVERSEERRVGKEWRGGWRA